MWEVARAAAPGTADVFTAPERERTEALWRLTALPRAEFDATYGAMLGGFWRFAAAARGEAWAALRRETLVCAVAASGTSGRACTCSLATLRRPRNQAAREPA